MWSQFSLTPLYLNGMWQGLWLRVDTKTMCVHKNNDIELYLKTYRAFQVQQCAQLGESIWDHLKERKKNLEHFDPPKLLHVNFDSETWNNKFLDSRLLTGWGSSQANPRVKIVRGVGSAHNMATYITLIRPHCRSGYGWMWAHVFAPLRCLVSTTVMVVVSIRSKFGCIVERIYARGHSSERGIKLHDETMKSIMGHVTLSSHE